MKTYRFKQLCFVLLLLLGAALLIGAGATSPSFVFVSRNTLANESPGNLPGFGPHHRTAIVGGKLMLRDKRGKIRVLVDSTKLIDVADPCVSWNGKKVLFSGVSHADSSWRIFEIGIDGRGFRQLTFSDRQLDLAQFGSAASLFARYDDFDPCYLPNGKICFASTRYPSMAMIAQVRASNLYVMEADGKNLHRITSERNGGEEPTIDPVTGRIVYARWWGNIDLPSNGTRNRLTRESSNALTDDIGNIWHAVSINPDGDRLMLYAGFMRTRYGQQSYKPALFQDGRLLSTFSPRTSLVPASGGTGIRWFNPGADDEHHIVGVKSDEGLRTKETVPPPYANDPVALSSSSILLSFSADGKEYGIYSCSLDGSDLKKVVDLPGTLELEPQIVAARKIPPVVFDQYVSPVSDLPPMEDPETHGRNDFFRFDDMNIFTNGKVDEPIPDAPRIARDLTIQFFMNPQRQSGTRPDPSILVKSAPVFYNGGIHEPEIPAEVPLFEQIVDKDGKVLSTTDGKFAHVAGFNFERLGSGTKCVGCHIGHSIIEVPKNGELSEWFNAAPSSDVTASSEFHDPNGTVYACRNSIDRQARVGGDSVIWVAGEGEGAWVTLHWNLPIEAKEFVLYNIPENPVDETNVAVRECKISLYYGGRNVASYPTKKTLSANGTIVSFAPTKIDSARITVTKFSGTIKRRPFAGLAEIETIARLFPSSNN